MRVFPLVVALLLVPVAVAAEEARPLEPVVVTATKLETPQEELGASVTVVTGEDLTTHHYETVGDVLRQVPGVEIQRSGGLGKLTSINIRGANSNQVQVLVDGVRVKSPTSGEFDFSDLSPDQIERIEIVRGPQSTLYGADAMGGVVQIITKRGQGPPSATMSVEGGNLGTHREKFGVSGSTKLLDYSLGGSYLASDGHLPNDDVENRALAGRVGLALPANGRLSLAARYNRSVTGLPVDQVLPTPPFFLLDPDQRQLSETGTVALDWSQKPVPWYELDARFGQYWNTVGFEDPDEFPHSRVDGSRREVELVNHFHAGKWNTLSLGIEHRSEHGESPGVFDKTIDVLAGFVEDEVRLFDRLFLSGGVRVEDNQVFGTEVTPRVGLAYLVKSWGTRFHGTWGQGFRAPTINDLFFPNFGNPALRPEHSESWDAGVDQKLWKNRVRLGATWFDNRFRDLIQFAPAGGGLFLPENVARARSEGLELTAEVDLLDNLFFTANYTYTDSEDLTAHTPLRRVAPHRWNLGLTWDPLRVLSLFVQANVVSSQFEAEGFPHNPGHHRIDVGGTWRIVERHGAFPALALVARIQNLTDERYMEVLGFTAPGINALAGLQAKY